VGEEKEKCKRGAKIQRIIQDQRIFDMRLLATFVLTLALCASAPGQEYTIRTFAGGAVLNNAPATSVRLTQSAAGVAVDGAGNMYFPENGWNVVLRMDAATGILTRFAGNGTAGYSGDNGPATSAELNTVGGVGADAAGNVYIADTQNNRIRKVSNGIITTVAGSAFQGYSGDGGPATSARLNQPFGVAVDASGNLYIADSENYVIRKVSNGTIATFAGNGTDGYSGDNGPATSATLGLPLSVAVDAAGNVYAVTDVVRKISNGIITTFAGMNGTTGYSGDNGPATSATFFYATAVAADASGNVYIADMDNNAIRKVSKGVITTFAGNGTKGYSGDHGPAAAGELNMPNGVAVDASGNVYIADSGNARIRKVSNGAIATVAGGASVSFGDNGPATGAALYQPSGVAVDASGDVYIVDYFDNAIRKVSNGVITTFAGNGTFGYSGDNGPATSAALNQPYGVAVDASGNVYIADTNNSVVRKVSGGVISTIAGNGKYGYSGDNGPAASAQLCAPTGVAVDTAGNVYIADNNCSAIRKVSNGIITTFAGNGTRGYSLDNGPAASTQLNSPIAVAVDASGDVYIADAGIDNNAIRVVTNGWITTFAGNGTNAYWGDGGPAASAGLFAPMGVTADAAGNVYISEGGPVDVIRKVSNGVIATIAGNGTRGYSGDNGPATGAELNGPMGLAVDAAGRVYIADAANQVIRVLIPDFRLHRQPY
jgi:sugar lactone lactonase YvrE